MARWQIELQRKEVQKQTWKKIDIEFLQLFEDIKQKVDGMDKEPGQDEAETEFLDSTCQALLRPDMESTQQTLLQLSQLREWPEGN